jgi:Hint domain
MIMSSTTTISTTVNAGVDLNTGTFAPNLSVTSTGRINAPSLGVESNSVANVTNAGTINGGSGAGILLDRGGAVTNSGAQSVIYGEQYGVIGEASTAVINYGTIYGTTHGVELRSGGLLHPVITVANIGSESLIYGGVEGRAPATVTNEGTITGYAYGVKLWLGGAVTNSGTIGGGYGAIRNIDQDGGPNYNLTVTALPGAVFNGIVEDDSHTGDLILAGSTTGVLNIDSFSGFQNISFASGAAWTLQADIAALSSGETITGFTQSDTIDITDLTLLAPETLTLDSNGVLEIDEGGVSLALILAPAYADALFTIASDNAGGTQITDNLPCFLAGTHIATPQGEALIEELRAGDIVLTSDGMPVPIRWIGVRSVMSRFVDPRRGYPIRIQAGAFAENIPTRDLLVSPDHAMFLDGILAQAGALVNGLSITRETTMPARFTYYHIEVADHALILAEGAATETFVDNVDRMNFDNWAEHEQQHLGAPPIAELPYPRAKGSRQLSSRIRQQLANRACAIAEPKPYQRRLYDAR